MTTITRVVKAKRMEPARVLRDPIANHIHPRHKRKEVEIVHEKSKQDV